MAPRTLAGLSTVLAAAGNVSEALNALSQDVIEHDRNGHVVLFIYDAKRDLLSERLIPLTIICRRPSDARSSPANNTLTSPANPPSTRNSSAWERIRRQEYYCCAGCS